MCCCAAMWRAACKPWRKRRSLACARENSCAFARAEIPAVRWWCRVGPSSHPTVDISRGRYPYTVGSTRFLNKSVVLMIMAFYFSAS